MTAISGAGLPHDIYTEQEASPSTLDHLGPLTALAGTWVGTDGVDIHPVAGGTETSRYSERFELVAIDPQSNGPQLFYGLRYHTHIVKIGEIETFHDQVGYLLWEPATEALYMSIAIPRGQVMLATGEAPADAKSFVLTALDTGASRSNIANPFLDAAFRTVGFTMEVTVHEDGGWSYEEDTVLEIRGRSERFHHRDSNTLRRVGLPVPNPNAPPDKQGNLPCTKA